MNLILQLPLPFGPLHSLLCSLITGSMRSARLPLLLSVFSALLAVGSAILRINHSISQGLCFAMMAAAMLTIVIARSLKKRSTSARTGK